MKFDWTRVISHNIADWRNLRRHHFSFRDLGQLDLSPSAKNRLISQSKEEKTTRKNLEDFLQMKKLLIKCLRSTFNTATSTTEVPHTSFSQVLPNDKNSVNCFLGENWVVLFWVMHCGLIDAPVGLPGNEVWIQSIVFQVKIEFSYFEWCVVVQVMPLLIF